MYGGVYEYSQNNCVLSDSHVWFQKGHFTEMALVTALNIVTDDIDSLFLDLRNAFDAVDNEILLTLMNLRHCSLRGTTLLWSMH